MATYTFTGPSCKATRKAACPTCGNPATRSTTFEQTLSPFNKNADGTEKTWAQADVAVKAQAAAWDPPADLFEHDKCKAARLAPPVAEPVEVSDEQLQRTADLRSAMAAVAAYTEQHHLPLASVELKQPWTESDGGLYTVTTPFVRDGLIVLWARTFGLDRVRVEDGGHCTYVRITHVAGGLRWRVDAAISRPSLGERIGGAPIEWHRDERTGKRCNSGTVAVDELAAGLARMGISVTVPAVAS